MLTDKEVSCLEIMQTDDMLAIGNWQPIIESLVAKGYARHVTGKFYRSTPAGQAAFDAMEDDQMRAMIGEHNARVRERDAVAVKTTPGEVAEFEKNHGGKFARHPPTIEGEAAECQT